MEEKKYLDFCKVRQVSFRGKYSQQFQNSLQEVVDSLGRASAFVWMLACGNSSVLVHDFLKLREQNMYGYLGPNLHNDKIHLWIP